MCRSPPLARVTASKPLLVRACDNDNFEQVLLAPKLSGGWYLLGEPSKWVSVSAQRFIAVTSNATAAAARVAGAVGEVVIIAWLAPRSPQLAVVQHSCTIGTSGEAVCSVTL